jgi:hypothetical protein
MSEQLFPDPQFPKPTIEPQPVKTTPPQNPAHPQQIERPSETPPLGPWAQEAKRVWTQERPFLVAHLIKLGALDEAANLAANNARQEFSNMVLQGVHPLPAWVGARQRFVLMSDLKPQNNKQDVARFVGRQTAGPYYPKWKAKSQQNSPSTQ